MNIVFINPDTKTNYPQPPLGLLSLATICQQEGHKVNIIDANVDKIQPHEFPNLVYLADVVGITATSLSYPEAVRIAALIKLKNPGKFIVIGGVHATIAYKEVYETGLFDAIVIREGEGWVKEVFERRLPGIYHSIEPLIINGLPLLDYGLIGDNYKYMAPHGLHKPVMPLLTSRGCPYHCSFCSKAVFGNKYRARSIDNVMNEIMALRGTYGIKEIIFYDDLFTLQKDRVIELSKRLAGEVAWACQTRVNLVDWETLTAMKEGGCYSIAFGIESGDPQVLKQIAKDITIEQTEQAVRYAQEAGLRVTGYFMIGSPGDNKETIKKTVNLAIKLDIDYAQFSVTTALPGSELYNMVPSEKRALTYALVDNDAPSLCELNRKELAMATSGAYKSFYLRPSYIKKQLSRMVRSWDETLMVIDGFKIFLGR